MRNWLICSGRRYCFSKALFFVGEFGVKDYDLVWNAGKTEDEVRSYVPKVVKNIVMAVEVYILCNFSIILLISLPRYQILGCNIWTHLHSNT